MKIVSYNLHMGLETEAIVKNIKDFAAQGVDVFCLQEFWKWMQPVDLEELFLKTLGPEWQIEYQTPEKPLHDYGACILWNKSLLEAISFERLPLPKITKARLWERLFVRAHGFGPEAFVVQRGALVGTFRWKGKILRVTTLHLDWAGGFKQRKTQIEFIRDYLNSHPGVDYEIICGDFNTLGIFNKKKQAKIISNILGSEFHNVCDTVNITCPPFQLDHMFVKNLRVNNFKVCKLPGSDHFPILSELVEENFQKEARVGEITMYQEILDQIADIYNESSAVLVLPKSISIDANANIITMPFYKGQTFNDLWNESTGGSLLGLDLSLEVPQILKDLAQVNISDIFKNEKIKNIPNFVFEHNVYLSELENRLKKFLDVGLIKKEEVDRARELLKEPYTSTMMFNNGDFYPRNFIRIPDKKIVLIDWEIWNPNNPFYLIDHPENVAAVCFVHMWNNKPWQEKYVAELQKSLPVTKRDFQKAILIKSLKMSEFWFQDNGNNDLCKNQISIFKNALSEEYMEHLWNRSSA